MGETEASPREEPAPPLPPAEMAGGPTAGVHTPLMAVPRPKRGTDGPAGTVPSGDSVHPDPRLIYAKTELGTMAVRTRSQRISLAARRLLMLLDGERPLGQLPNVVRPDDGTTLLKELEAQGMVTLAGLWHDDPQANAMHPERKLAELKRALSGVFEKELGPEASVLEARVQDCVNLVVLRNVLREVIGLVARRKDDAAADRVAAIVKSHGPF